jgi:CheY-like chemotaxis protein
MTQVTSIDSFALSRVVQPDNVQTRGVEECARTPNMPKVALVVDDSMLIRYSVCRFLEKHGFAVESATNGSEALDLMRRSKPDLIVTDMKMPKMSGEEFITVLKSNPETAKVPIILVTSNVKGCGEAEKRADFAIYKNIDIETQLGKALEVLSRQPRPAQTTGN